MTEKAKEKQLNSCRDLFTVFSWRDPHEVDKNLCLFLLENFLFFFLFFSQVHITLSRIEDMFSFINILSSRDIFLFLFFNL